MAGGNLHLILLAGGQGLRAGESGSVPKQFRPTGSGLLFAVSLREFLTLKAGTGFRPVDVILTVADAWQQTAGDALQDLDIPWSLAPAGNSRTASTWNAVSEMETRYAPGAGDLVAVHDAARPFASADLLVRLGRAAAGSSGAVPGVPVPDTIVQSKAGVQSEDGVQSWAGVQSEVGVQSEDGVQSGAGIQSEAAAAVYLDRTSLQAVQTPQVFRWDVFREAHAWASETGTDFTDDGGLLAVRGHPPVVVAGEQGNWKVTTNGDWYRAETLLNSG